MFAALAQTHTLLQNPPEQNLRVYIVAAKWIFVKMESLKEVAFKSDSHSKHTFSVFLIYEFYQPARVDRASTRCNRCSHISDMNALCWHKESARKLNKRLMASLKPTNSPHADIISLDGWWWKMRRTGACSVQVNGKRFITMWANACSKHNPFNLSFNTQIIWMRERKNTLFCLLPATSSRCKLKTTQKIRTSKGTYPNNVA